MASLKDHTFQIAYGPGDDRVKDFYIPALSASVRYDRSAGFFSSSALAVAAAGVARLIQNGGRMRLLVGAQLSEPDIQALQGGEDLAAVVARRMETDLDEATDAIAKERLAALAWMVKQGTLEVKVVLPKDKNGVPLPASQSIDYYHPKMGIFTDADGEQVAFSGSINESAQAWERNYEMFDVYISWNPNLKPFITQKTRYFERLWDGQEADWIALPVPEAVKQKLLRHAPEFPPTRDPLEKPESEPEVPEPAGLTDEQRERIIFQFLRDAPYLPNADKLGQEVITIRPWPHQVKVADKIVASYPHRYMICDEVGLGKTIEAGLVLKQLTLSGKVKRALILAPKSVCRQWQEELYEKFLLNIPFYDGHQCSDYFERDLPIETPNHWDAFPIMIASSQLAKRKERMVELHEAEPWDLLLVDEAHHARRKDFLSGHYRRNSLLTLLLGSPDSKRLGGLAQPGRSRSLVLMTATPMQVDPVEVWDLLTVLGVGGRWGASEDSFLDYFNELNKPDFTGINWPFVMGMMRDYFDNGGDIDRNFANQALKSVGLVTWESIKGLPYSKKIFSVVEHLDTKGQAVLKEFARRHTPLNSYVFRNTRTLLRKYQELGLLGNNRVPHRLPKNEWIDMTPDERELYERIEEYISDFYKKYEAERKGLGFIMTVYRRRLTSSFHAIRESLQRRLAFLKGDPDVGSILTDEDTEQEELSIDIGENIAGASKETFEEEITYVEDFLNELRHIDTDSKVERLIIDLNALLQRRETVLVFTLYTDTMDFLRDKLRQVYGSQVACYSGRGGEIWDGRGWVKTTKEEVKNDFRNETIKILLCTESASEGLNLQTCGVLINFDMPWNPMRVEQRIGRIDRIGQRHEEVWIRNYFYDGTVESNIYKALEGRIHWFEHVVGSLQPILAKVARAIQTAAMESGVGRVQALEREIESLKEELDQQQTVSLDLDQYIDEGVEAPPEDQVPVTPAQIQEAILNSKRLGQLFSSHREFTNAYRLMLDGQAYDVTFDRNLFDQYPDSLRLLSYQEELFTKLLNKVAEADAADLPKGIVRIANDDPAVRAYYAERKGEVHLIPTMEKLLACLKLEDSEPASEFQDTAKSTFENIVEGRKSQIAAEEARSKRTANSLLEEKVRQLLFKATYLEIALSAAPELFDSPVPLSFSEDTVRRLANKGFPFGPALTLVSIEGMAPDQHDPYYLQVKYDNPNSNKSRLEKIKSQLDELVQQLAASR